jgi:hypothetical protein
MVALAGGCVCGGCVVGGCVCGGFCGVWAPTVAIVIAIAAATPLIHNLFIVLVSFRETVGFSIPDSFSDANQRTCAVAGTPVQTKGRPDEPPLR